MIDIIQLFLAPAVMFSAGGLLCLAQFGRLNAVMGQVRTLNRERLTILQDTDRAKPQQRELLLQRAEGLEQQAGKMLDHTATVRNALRFLVGGILLMVLSSLTIGASLLFEPLGIAAVVLFVLGLALIFVGLCLVLIELGVSLDVINFENDNLNRLRRGEGLLPPEVLNPSDIDQKTEERTDGTSVY